MKPAFKVFHEAVESKKIAGINANIAITMLLAPIEAYFKQFLKNGEEIDMSVIDNIFELSLKALKI
jgi:hypothetical protein